MALGASHRLHDGIEAVETMTRFALAVLALASGVYTYLGVRSLLDGSPTSTFFAALIYSAAVSVAAWETATAARQTPAAAAATSTRPLLRHKPCPKRTNISREQPRGFKT